MVLPWHNPVLIAEAAGTLDLLSNGRLDFGVGKGYRPYEFSGFCIPQQEATERFDEAMEVIRRAWAGKDRFSYRGKWWRYDNIVVEPVPIQQPHPPFWMGAGSPESIKRAAREGYNLLLDQIAPIDMVIDRVRIFREECQAIGRRYDPMMVGVTRGLQIVHNDEERKRAILSRRSAWPSATAPCSTTPSASGSWWPRSRLSRPGQSKRLKVGDNAERRARCTAVTRRHRYR